MYMLLVKPLDQLSRILVIQASCCMEMKQESVGAWAIGLESNQFVGVSLVPLYRTCVLYRLSHPFGVWSVFDK